MRTRALWVVILVVLVGASLAAAQASAPVKRYTFPEAATWRVVSPETLTVSFPAGWRVSPTWIRGRARPSAVDPVHTSVQWQLYAYLEKTGTTLTDIRQRSSFRGWRNVWGERTPLMLQVGDAYLSLPVGKVWRRSVLLVPSTEEGWAGRYYFRSYWLDRGVVREIGTGAEKRLFLEFNVSCKPDECQAHNGQLAAIMRSIRLTP